MCAKRRRRKSQKVGLDENPERHTMVLIVQDLFCKRSPTMVNFKRILFPVEFTPQCQIAARDFAAYARHFDADVSLLHVEMLPFEPYVWEPKTDRLNQMLDQFLVNEFTG